LIDWRVIDVNVCVDDELSTTVADGLQAHQRELPAPTGN